MTEKISTEELCAYMDGDLAPDECSRVEALLAVDDEARDALAALCEIQAAAEALPTELAPERDLWNDIASRLEPRQDRVPHSWLTRHLWDGYGGRFGLAAAALLLVLSASHFFHALQDSDTIGVKGPSSPPLTKRFAVVDREYQQARAAVLAPLQDADSPLSEDTLTAVRESLTRIDEALAAIEKALEDSPENPRLVTLLVATRERERSLLRQLGELARGV